MSRATRMSVVAMGDGTLCRSWFWYQRPTNNDPSTIDNKTHIHKKAVVVLATIFLYCLLFFAPAASVQHGKNHSYLSTWSSILFFFDCLEREENGRNMFIIKDFRSTTTKKWLDTKREAKSLGPASWSFLYISLWPGCSRKLWPGQTFSVHDAQRPTARDSAGQQTNSRPQNSFFGWKCYNMVTMLLDRIWWEQDFSSGYIS